jgi:hypothetical protein
VFKKSLSHFTNIFLFCLPAVTLAQNPGSAEIANASAALRKSLLAGQGSDSIRAGSTLIGAIFSEIKVSPPSSFETSQSSRMAKPNPPAASLADLLPLLTKIDSSVGAGELVLARDYAMALQSAIGETVRVQRPSAAKVLADLEEKSLGVSGFQRFLVLPRLAVAAFDAGDTVKADSYSSEWLADNEKYGKTGNSGEAIFYGNLVKGRIEMAKGNISGATAYLLAAGHSAGSPHLDSFGPNMALARDLLSRGQSEAVLAYLELCTVFWKEDHGALNAWQAVIRAGNIPDFGPNLNY